MNSQLDDYWFTNRVIEVLRIATERAREMGHECVEPRHILWAMLEEGEGMACRMLAAMGLDRAKMKAQLAWSMPAEEWEHGEDGVPYRESTKEVLHLALAAKRQLEDPATGTEHVLLGLVMLREHGGADSGLPSDCTLEAALAALRRVDPIRTAGVQRWLDHEKAQG